MPHDLDAAPVAESSQCLQQIPFSCDSFDAAIAAHISRHQNKMGVLSTLASHASSIWDAEETCDAFSFQKNPVLCNEVSRLPVIAPPADCKQIARTNSVGSGGFFEVSFARLLHRRRNNIIASVIIFKFCNLSCRSYSMLRALLTTLLMKTLWMSVSAIPTPWIIL